MTSYDPKRDPYMIKLNRECEEWLGVGLDQLKTDEDRVRVRAINDERAARVKAEYEEAHANLITLAKRAGIWNFARTAFVLLVVWAVFGGGGNLKGQGQGNRFNN